VGKIFISYRREDSTDAAGRVYDRLVTQFGKANVFKDVDDIPLGRDFREALRDAVGECDIMLVVIGHQWLTATDEQGRRLDNPGDFVRIEVEAALTRDIPVIPVLVQGAGVPRERDLPSTLAQLAYRNGLPVRSDPHFHGDMNLLIARMGPALAPGLIERGEELADQERYAEALPLFELATQLDAQSATGWHCLGSTLDELSRCEEAAVAYDRALALDPDDAFTWFDKGNALSNCDRYQDSVMAYDRALALDPEFQEAWHNKAIALSNMDRNREAVDAYDRALTLDPDNTEAWDNKGSVLYGFHRFQEALVAHDRALALDPRPSLVLGWERQFALCSQTL